MVKSWQFTENDGTFSLMDPHHSNYLYFPLVNEVGMMSVVTPTLHGDSKAGQHQFLMPPVSVFDLHNTHSGRNFWLTFSDHQVWSATGNGATQNAQQFTQDRDEVVSLMAGMLWQKITRENKKLGLRAEICNFVPISQDQVELMMVKIINISNRTIQFTPTAAIPIYGRSADNLRDHRHVTSLLHRITCTPFGVVVNPTLTFDERGHQENDLAYAVLGMGEEASKPVGFFPVVDDFIGEGGNLSWPEAVVRPLQPLAKEGCVEEGYEALGGLRFAQKELAAGESCSYVLVLAILPSEADLQTLVNTYGSVEKFDQWLNRTKAYWQERLNHFGIKTMDHTFDQWMKWVCLQPTLRRLFGNSFLPYHDYGRGGRGWRDLWQDILALMITDGASVEEFLLSNFAGVRLDGSNATIIRDQPGQFKADRNNIPRVWMDHGAWPFLTIEYYIDQTGDLEFLLRNQVYFKDHFIYRAQQIDQQWNPSLGTVQRSTEGKIYQGSVLEHLLIQHLTAFFNVGEHNIIRLEGADWNDALDMAPERGESVAFTALYAGNLRQISVLMRELAGQGTQTVELAVELGLLLDTLHDKVDYGSPSQKQERLKQYFAAVAHEISGKKQQIQLDDLARDLEVKASWLVETLRSNEWISSQEGHGWFNGYYDNDGAQIEGDHPKGIRMTLTGQVFTLLCGIADDQQARQIIESVDQYLIDPAVGGPRLNTNFKEVLLNMGRCFGFAYGHKENGAMFSHMAVMYAYALYERGFVQQGYQILDDIYTHSLNFEKSRMYPGIPEYFDDRGRGVYPYLTGSASWYIFTLLTQAFGVRGHLGDLKIRPKLVASQFDVGDVQIRTTFAGRKFNIIFKNPDRLDYGQYRVEAAILNNEKLPTKPGDEEILIPRESIMLLDPADDHQLTIHLAEK